MDFSAVIYCSAKYLGRSVIIRRGIGVRKSMILRDIAVFNDRNTLVVNSTAAVSIAAAVILEISIDDGNIADFKNNICIYGKGSEFSTGNNSFICTFSLQYDRITDGQSGFQLNGSRRFKCDFISTRIVIGIEDCLTQGAFTFIIEVGDGVVCKIVFKVFNNDFLCINIAYCIFQIPVAGNSGRIGTCCHICSGGIGDLFQKLLTFCVCGSITAVKKNIPVFRKMFSKFRPLGRIKIPVFHQFPVQGNIAIIAVRDKMYGRIFGILAVKICIEFR